MDAIKFEWIANAFIFSTMGIAIFWVAFILIDKITPYDLWGEIVEKRNQALATIVAAMCLGIAIIVAAAVHG
ncbi:MAG: DUF350 domain-containing protein [Desulfobulbaceae bacterium]|nr:DUF350 domain-containing protein [Desulfobulbaceae bacterium]